MYSDPRLARTTFIPSRRSILGTGALLQILAHARQINLVHAGLNVEHHEDIEPAHLTLNEGRKKERETTRRSGRMSKLVLQPVCQLAASHMHPL